MGREESVQGPLFACKSEVKAFLAINILSKDNFDSPEHPQPHLYPQKLTQSKEKSIVSFEMDTYVKTYAIRITLWDNETNLTLS